MVEKFEAHTYIFLCLWIKFSKNRASLLRRNVNLNKKQIP